MNSDQPTPETQTIKELLEVMHEHDLDAIKVKVRGKIFELVRREGGSPAAPSAGPAAPAPVLPASGAPANAKKIIAPLVGVFYRSASPDSEPFVKIGDRVEAGQVVCILEAMKLFNEITSDYSGVLARIIPENGELVSLGQEMFWIEP
ncbi:MAG: acetyl-CoA carboxylase biotin carboxyl carrier protein subunit [Candidatus Baltobacteraceae bacterium]